MALIVGPSVLPSVAWLLPLHRPLYVYKKQSFPSSSDLVAQTLGADFHDFYWLPAEGTRGGILLAWRADHVSLSNRTIGTYHVSATVTEASGGPP